MYLKEKELQKHFTYLLMKELCLDEEESKYLISYYMNPCQSTCLREEFILETEIDNVLWEKRACILDLSCLGVKKPIYKYYIFYNRNKMEDLSVESYMNTEKMYQLTKINKNDFDF